MSGTQELKIQRQIVVLVIVWSKSSKANVSNRYEERTDKKQTLWRRTVDRIACILNTNIIKYKD